MPEFKPCWESVEQAFVLPHSFIELAHEA